MAIVILTHVFFAFVAVGGLVLAFVSEWIGYKSGSAYHDRFAEGYVKFLSDMMKLGGVLGVAIVVFTISLFPEFAKKLYNIFFWPLFLEVGLFMLMMAATICYRITWGTAKSKARHIAVGGIAALAAVAAALVINAAHAFMLTPGMYFEEPTLFNAVFNPTMLASSTHLMIPCILNAALFAYIYAFFKIRKAANSDDAGYYSWMADFSGKIFAVGIFLQPLSGLSFLFKVKSVNGGIFMNIINGNVARFFWPMVSLGGIAIIASVIYLSSRSRLRSILLVGGLAALTAFSFGGYTRERARKPYLIYGQMYMSEAFAGEPTKADVAAAVKPDAKSSLQKYGCLACHKYKGEGGTFGPVLDAHLKHHPKDWLKKFLKTPPQAMPPFRGTEKELDEFVEAITK